MSGVAAAARRTARTLAVSLLVALAWTATPAAAQIGGGPGGGQLGVGGWLETYSFADPERVGVESLTLFTTRFGAAATVSSRLRLEARGAFANGSLTLAGGTEATLSGLTDTEVRATVAVVPDALGLEVVGYLPTGEATLDAEEALVAGAVAADLLPLAVAQWGSAGALAVAVTGTRRLGRFGVGVTASYRLTGGYDPVTDSDFTYEPGDELRVRVAVDHPVGRSGKLSFAAGMRRFGEDVGDERNLFQTGDRLELTGTYSFPAGLRGAGALYAALVMRDAGTFLLQDDVMPSQDLFLAGGVLRLPLGGHHVLPRVDARLFRPDDGAGQGWVAGVGASMEMDAGGATIVPNLGARLGRVEGATGEGSSMTGFAGGLTVRFGGGR